MKITFKTEPTMWALPLALFHMHDNSSNEFLITFLCFHWLIEFKPKI